MNAAQVAQNLVVRGKIIYVITTNPKTLFSDVALAEMKRPRKDSKLEEIGKYKVQCAVRKQLGIEKSKWVRLQPVAPTNKDGLFRNTKGHFVNLNK